MEQYLVNIIECACWEKVREKVSVYRTHMNIIGDILLTTRDDIEVEQGASVTYLIRKANVSHVRIFFNVPNNIHMSSIYRHLFPHFFPTCTFYDIN